jgi:hypothetical protein
MSSDRYRCTSIASPFAVSYRRPRSFSRHFITTQSSSPRTSLPSRFGSIRRLAAIAGNSSLPLSRVLGLGGSSSRMIRSNSSNAAVFSRLRSNGVEPVSSS